MFRSYQYILARGGVAITCILCFIGCGSDEITVYKIAKESEAVAAETAVTSNTAEEPFFCPKPTGWSQADPGPMQRARFEKTNDDGEQAVISIVVLPGEAGGDLPNINRWRRQIGLPPVSSTADLYKEWTIGDRTFKHVQIKNDEQSIDVVYRLDSQQSYFYKMQGPLNITESEQKTFMQFVHIIWKDA